MIAPIGFDETEEQYIARLEAEIARQAASHGSAGAAQAPISSDDLTDYVVDAALSEYWDLSPRGWSETQRVAMRKAILTALAVPSALRQCPICARRVTSPCETLAIATSCPLSSTTSKSGV